MAQSMLMKRGLEGLFSPEKKFEAEASYGRKILYVAWAVEILAATIGLTIAWATAYDAYAGIESPDQSHLLNALIGALPFLVIAVIEPTKIPLAGGFYKTRILGWKILILLALLGLTAVTFETMFNGLERNLTSVTRKVVESENRIQYLSDQLNENKRELDSLSNESESEITSGLTEALEQQRRSYQDFVDNENRSLSEQTNPIIEQKRSLQNSFAQLAGDAGQANKAQMDIILKNISSLEAQIQSIERTRESDVKAYTDSLSFASDNANNADKIRIEGLNRQKAEKQKEITKRRDENKVAKDAFDSRISSSEKDLRTSLEKLSKQNENERKEVWNTAPVDKKYKGLMDGSRAAHRDTVRRATQSYNEIAEVNNQRVEELLEEISKIDVSINEILSSRAGETVTVDQSRIDKIRSVAETKITNIRKSIETAQNQITQISNAQSGASKRQRDSLQAQINQFDAQIKELTEASSKRIAERKERFASEEEKIAGQRQSRIDASTEQKKKIPQLQQKIVEIQNEIDENKKIKREASYDSQVYRLAALAYGKTDVADVNREEIKVVSVIWFGSIAFIVSTIGTILALISYILRDPEAFVERKKFNLGRRISVVIRSINRALLSGIKLVGALTRLVFSFAEVFRGIIGKPVQRSVRRAMLAYRRRAHKPRIETKEIEVEKIVEVEIEKIVEVEKVVEKIVEVEVPIEKIVIQEVPKEIVRKELVYVPLYSTDSGLIDASTELRGAKPKISEANSTETKKETVQTKPSAKNPNGLRAKKKKRV